MAGQLLYRLGSPHLVLDGKPVNSVRRKALALLAYLTVEAGQQRRKNPAGFLAGLWAGKWLCLPAGALWEN